MKRFLIASALSLSLVSPAFAAIEIDENEPFGPTYGTAMADTFVAKPVQLAGAVLGTAAYVVSFPFAVASNSVDTTFDSLVVKPWNALGRCVGCTGAYDNYRNTLQNQQGEVRFTVDRPSEIVIQSNGAVLVNQ